MQYFVRASSADAEAGALISNSIAAHAADATIGFTNAASSQDAASDCREPQRYPSEATSRQRKKQLPERSDATLGSQNQTSLPEKSLIQ